ncbi:hypothetical protein HB860_07235 [Aeromonas sp. 3925]|uniref:hypothetical protein n=1 Tax=Aeromonas genomosp. paramedia TaxID=3086176 RepID=UPI001FFCF7C8|nr:hypothetical protein [Aeromonas genomosp. paramedia]MCK2083727.1 hypothetical protein [Aeromonas genomosp. paramedia]
MEQALTVSQALASGRASVPAAASLFTLLNTLSILAIYIGLTAMPTLGAMLGEAAAMRRQAPPGLLMM